MSGLRPTSDRVRETLFNWLAPIIDGTCCLDVFSGSGALAFEALSRGALRVYALEAAPRAVYAIRTTAEQLQIDAGSLTIQQARVPCSLERFENVCFDIIFLDPPFRQNLVSVASEWLEQQVCFSKATWIYIEAEAELNPLPIPAHWKIIRAKKAGGSAYYLILREVNV